MPYLNSQNKDSEGAVSNTEVEEVYNAILEFTQSDTYKNSLNDIQAYRAEGTTKIGIMKEINTYFDALNTDLATLAKLENTTSSKAHTEHTAEQSKSQNYPPRRQKSKEQTSFSIKVKIVLDLKAFQNKTDYFKQALNERRDRGTLSYKLWKAYDTVLEFFSKLTLKKGDHSTYEPLKRHLRGAKIAEKLGMFDHINTRISLEDINNEDPNKNQNNIKKP